METTYFTFTTCEPDVSGNAAAAGSGCRRRLAYSRPAVGKEGGKVIDLEQWRVEHGAAPPPEPGRGGGGPSRPRREERRRREPMLLALQAAELLTTLSAAGVIAALAVRLLVP